MDVATALQHFDAWTPDERWEFVRRAWDRLADDGRPLEPDDGLKAELDRRLAAHAADPDDVVTWEQLVAHVRRPR